MALSPLVNVRITTSVALTPALQVPSQFVVQNQSAASDFRSYLTNIAAGGTFALEVGSLPTGLTISGNGMLGSVTTAAATYASITVRYTNGAATVVSNPFSIVVGDGAVFNAQGQWTPPRDGAQTILPTAWQTLPANTWVQVANTAMVPIIKPQFDAIGATLYAYGSAGLAGLVASYSGTALSPNGNRAILAGGGHEDGACNGVVEFDVPKMQYIIRDFGSRVGVDGFTAQDAVMYGDTRQGVVSASRINIREYARSATGFAAKLFASLSTFAWVNALGPARLVTDPEAIVYPNNGKVNSWQSQPFHIAFENPPPGDQNQLCIMPDGRPAALHTYNGNQIINNEYWSLTRQVSRCRLDGLGWRLHPAVGARFGYSHPVAIGELTWSIHIPSLGKVYRGGCGGNCQSPYTYYGAADEIDTTTGAMTIKYGLTTNVNNQQLYLGTHDAFCVDNNRAIWSMNVYPADVNYQGFPDRPIYVLSYDFVTNVKYACEVSYDNILMTAGEGQSQVWMPNINRLLRFDTNAGKAYKCIAIDITPSGPTNAQGAFIKPRVLFPLANSATVPVGGLVYNRIWNYTDYNVLVALTNANGNVCVCRVVAQP